jgi:hypothetical protein
MSPLQCLSSVPLRVSSLSLPLYLFSSVSFYLPLVCLSSYISPLTVKILRMPCCTQVTKTKDSYLYRKSRSPLTTWRAGD